MCFRHCHTDLKWGEGEEMDRQWGTAIVSQEEFTETFRTLETKTNFNYQFCLVADLKNKNINKNLHYFTNVVKILICCKLQ
jgi:hypothetical protein